MEKQLIKTSLSEIHPLIMDCFREGLSVTFTITGSSMLPFLKHNRDQVVLAKADAEHLQPGDVPLYIRDNGQYVLHRIVAVDNGTYTMLGDAQTIKEYGIRPDQIVGVAQGFICNGKLTDCQSRLYRRKTSWWSRLLFMRPVLLRLYWLFFRIGNVFFRKHKS